MLKTRNQKNSRSLISYIIILAFIMQILAPSGLSLGQAWATDTEVKIIDTNETPDNDAVELEGQNANEAGDLTDSELDEVIEVPLAEAPDEGDADQIRGPDEADQAATGQEQLPSDSDTIEAETEAEDSDQSNVWEMKLEDESLLNMLLGSQSLDYEQMRAAKQPVLLISGNAIIGNGEYTENNINQEKAYSLAELLAIAEQDENAAANNQYLYSAINTANTKSVFRGEGIRLAALLAKTDADLANNKVTVFAGDGYKIVFDPAKTTVGVTNEANISQVFTADRYYYPQIGDNSDAGAIEVPTIVAWAEGGARGTIETPTEVSAYDDSKLRIMAGQLALNDYNNPLFNGPTPLFRVLIGDQQPIATIALKTKDDNYTRAQLLMMERTEQEHRFVKTGASDETVAEVRGVSLAKLLEKYKDNDVIKFAAADGFKVAADGMTKKDLVDKHAILAYETKNQGNWEAIYSTAKNDKTIKGYLTLYVDNMTPAKMVDNITIDEKSYAGSPYKHINNGGLSGSAPYNIDAITGATLTVEGPGVKATTPMSVRELENSADAYIHRGAYNDFRDNETSLLYEGIIIKDIIEGHVKATVAKVDEDVVLVFKNRWRQEVARIPYNDVITAKKPLILAYGTGTLDGTSVAPFVYDGALGTKPELGNDDGCLKLVYDLNEFQNISKSKKFLSVAYIYVEPSGGTPGYKHSQALDPAYSNKTNTEYLLTFTGALLGREVNYTIAELEAMVEYDDNKRPKADGLGYRDEYGLSNTTYWYVNEYEGIKLWELLTQKLGLDAEQYKNDNTNLVSFTAWDNYLTTAKFSLQQLANPDLFMFYEKSPLDIGTARPTKEQLATAAYQPDNREGNWSKDSNNYPVKKGYPVLLAYGVNGYPYVRSSTLEGFRSGLGNDGGPVRVIFGKADNMNRIDSNAPDNYAYFYNNGSNQLQRAQEIYVGDEIRYSTHAQNPDYAAMKDNPALTIEINGTQESHELTLSQLENILYGTGITKKIRDTEGRQEKGYYYYKKAGNGDQIQDLFEGVNLNYLLTEYIGLPGSLGSVDLYGGDTLKASYQLNQLGAEGFNSINGTDKLGMMIAFAKNGYPLVNGKGTGYVDSDTVTGKVIKNTGGPLLFVRGQTEQEKNGGIVDTINDNKTIVENLTKIVVNMEADAYAHTGETYSGYGDMEVKFSGALAKPGDIKISDLEKKQKYLSTREYTIGDKAVTYRGLELFRLLNDSSIGSSALLNAIIVKNGQDSIELSIADLTDSNKKIILAYGIAGSGGILDGKPLVPEQQSPGFDAGYNNSGGPLRLIINNGTASQCITSVTEIELIAGAINDWTHKSGNFAPYASHELEINGNKIATPQKVTVAALEALDNIKVADTYKMGGEFFMQGIDLYKYLQGIGFKDGLDTAVVTAYSGGFSAQFDGAQLKNGVNGKPIIIAYGQGLNATQGLPLVENEQSPGYDSNYGNAFGPLRLVVHDNTGWCVKWLEKIVVGDSEVVIPVDTNDFSIFGLSAGVKNYRIGGAGGIMQLPNDKGKATANYSYTQAGEKKTDYVKGAYLQDILADAGVTDPDAKITINTTDGYETKQESYRDILLKDAIAKKYFLAYDAGPSLEELAKIEDADKNGVKATVRIYRNFNDGENWQNRLTSIKGISVTMPIKYTFNSFVSSINLPYAKIRSIKVDSQNGIWIGTYGTGMAYKSASDTSFTFYNTEGTPKLENDFVSALAVDKDGGVWFSQNASYSEPQNNRGIGYLKNGSITWYRAADNPATIPSDYVQAIEIDSKGDVWFGSFGGITKYDPTANTWRTWTKADGLPAASVNTITFEKSGGLWIGCYPDGTGTENDLFKGGYAHMNSAGVIDFAKTYEGQYDSTLQSSLLADAWVRGIAVDSKGGAWIVRSGSYPTLANVGGRVDHVSGSGSNRTVVSYTGKELLGENLAGNHEIRMVAVDKADGLWFGTSGSGVIYCKKLNEIENVYSSGNQAWPDIVGMDNIYYLGFVGNTLYVGSDAGLAYNTFNIGGGTGGGENDAILTVTRNGSNKDYSLNDLKNLGSTTASYPWLNNYGSKGTESFTGIKLSTVLNNSGLLSGGKSVKISSADGYYRVYNIDSSGEPTMNFINGGPMLLAWKQSGNTLSGLQLVVAQQSTDDVNRDDWVSDVSDIEISTSTGNNGEGTPGPGSSGSSNTKQEEEKTPLALESQVKVENGVASMAITVEDMEKALKVLADDTGSKNIIVNCSTGETINKSVVELPYEVLKRLVDQGQAGLSIRTNHGDLTVVTEVLAGLLAAMKSGNTATIAVANIDNGQEESNPGHPAIDISFAVDGTELTSLQSFLKFAIPYTPSEEEKEDKILAYHVDANGNRVAIPMSGYNADDKAVIGFINHLSVFAVGYNDQTFGDSVDHWASKNVEFLAARAVVSGKAENAFDPNANVTRAEFIKMLAATIEGLRLEFNPETSFEDIDPAAWYGKYVLWAAEQKIVNGFEDGLFKPDTEITREQMALITYKFITELNLGLSQDEEAEAFADQDQISAWALNAVNEMHALEILNGDMDGNFKPQDHASRAEASTIIKKILEIFMQR